MAYHVEIESAAAQYLVRLTRGDRASLRRITTAIKALGENPRPAGAVKLVGSDGWRVRAGDYRVIYLITDSVRVVTVTKVGHRRDIYER